MTLNLQPGLGEVERIRDGLRDAGGHHGQGILLAPYLQGVSAVAVRTADHSSLRASICPHFPENLHKNKQNIGLSSITYASAVQSAQFSHVYFFVLLTSCLLRSSLS